ncbi:hypothetical protein OAH18_00870 [bacterium]|nr:hypothetical protein [bacterium]
MAVRSKRNLAILAVMLLIALLVWMSLVRTRLNDAERRLVGVWTYLDAPGETVYHFRDDGTLRFSAPFGSATFMRWWIDDGNLTVENKTADTVLPAKATLWIPPVVQRRVFGLYSESFPISFGTNGELILRYQSGDRTMVPWQGKYSEEIQLVE